MTGHTVCSAPSIRKHLTIGILIISLAIIAVALMAPSSVAYATPTSAEKQAEAEAALVTLNAMQQSYDEAFSKYHLALTEQEEAQAKMDGAQQRIDEATAQIGAVQEKLGSRVRNMYRTGNTTFLDLLLGSTSFEAFVNNWDLLNLINEDDAAMIQQVKDLRAEVTILKDEYAKQERIAAEKAEEARIVKEEAEATVVAMQATYDSLSAEAAELLAQERAAQEAANAAQAEATVANSAAGGRGSSSHSGGTSVPYNAGSGNAIVNMAYSMVGKPYVFGAAGPDSFDCSGLVMYCYGAAGIGVAHYTGTYMGYTQVSDPQPGDICTSSGHAGIYIGGGMMIHAPQPGETVCVAPIQSGMIIVRP